MRDRHWTSHALNLIVIAMATGFLILNPMGAQFLYGDALGVPATIVEGAGHITPDTGYGPWPFATEWCLRTQPQT